jgi:hypothetical protein
MSTSRIIRRGAPALVGPHPTLRYLVLSVAALGAACGDQAGDPAGPRTPEVAPATPALSAVTAPALLLTAHALFYCYTPGGNRMCVVLRRDLGITSSRGPLQWTASKSQPWIVMSPSVTTPSSVVISVNSGKLPWWRPVYGRVTISAAGASNSPQVVDLVVGRTARPLGLPALAFSDSAIGFCYFPASSRGCVRLAEHVQFSSTGASLAWKAVGSKPWIVIQPTTGSTDTDVRVSVDFTTLPPWKLGSTSLSAALTVSASGAGNSPQTIPVKLQFYSTPPPQ